MREPSRPRADPGGADPGNHRQGPVGAPGRGPGASASKPPDRGIDIGRASARNAAKPVDADLAALERQLGDILGLKVQVDRTRGRAAR